MVLRGAGRAFCAGLDLKEDSDVGVGAAGLRAQRTISELVMMMRRAPQPIIACVHGAACGGGFALGAGHGVGAIGACAAAAAAHRQLHRGARAPSGSAWARASSPTAQLDAAAQALADDMLRNSPLGLRLTKECLNASLDAGSLEQVIAMEDRNQILCSRSEDFRKASRVPAEAPPEYRDGRQHVAVVRCPLSLRIERRTARPSNRVASRSLIARRPRPRAASD